MYRSIGYRLMKRHYFPTGSSVQATMHRTGRGVFHAWNEPWLFLSHC